MSKFRIIFWRGYYAITNPFRHLYWRIVQPESRGVKCLIKNGNAFLFERLAYAHKQWTLPGGGVDTKESFEEAAWRELKEETAVKPSSLTFFGQYESRMQYKHNTVQCFYGETDSNLIHCDPLEIAEAGWFRREDFPQNRSSSVDKVMKLYDEIYG